MAIAVEPLKALIDLWSPDLPSRAHTTCEALGDFVAMRWPLYEQPEHRKAHRGQDALLGMTAADSPARLRRLRHKAYLRGRRRIE
ncbi:MAG: hypothetical protein QOE65_2013 [Solirubrobacteraceae bacterium]|nr:hypothetical protein [Solirubrobacteraceae bacterium]